MNEVTDDIDSGGKIVCLYHKASGLTYRDCVFLGQRYREEWGDSPDDSDYWVLGNQPASEGSSTTTTCLFSWKDWLTGIWRAPGGTVYISDATIEGVHRYDDIFDVQRPPTDFKLETALEGIWGLDEEHVFTWGTRKSGSGNFEWPVFRFDGRRWTELPMPGFAVMDIHGIAPDLVYAVGFNGYVGRWDGGGWKRFPVPTVEVLNCVFVAGSDEMYACGGNGSVLEGSAHGWGKIAEMPEEMPAHAVAKFGDQLFVAGGSLGLFRRIETSGELEIYKDKIGATWFDAREHLIITAENIVGGTTDGVSFAATAINTLCKITGDKDIIRWDDHVST